MPYSAKYIEHFTNPRGIGEIEPSDGWSEVQHEGQGCFDKVKLTLQIENNQVLDAKFRARACSGTIAACSALIEMIRNKDIDYVKSITADDIEQYLDGIPSKKKHSVELAVKALKNALTGENLAVPS